MRHPGQDTNVLTPLPLSTEKKKMHNLKVENYVLFGGPSEDFKPRIALQDCSEEVRGEAGTIGVLQQRQGSRNIKRLLLLKENQISQVNEFSPFLRMGKCKNLGSLESFL